MRILSKVEQDEDNIATRSTLKSSDDLQILQTALSRYVVISKHLKLIVEISSRECKYKNLVDRK